MVILTKCYEVRQLIDFTNSGIRFEVFNGFNMTNIIMFVIPTYETMFREFGFFVNPSCMFSNHWKSEVIGSSFFQLFQCFCFYWMATINTYCSSIFVGISTDFNTALSTQYNNFQQILVGTFSNLIVEGCGTRNRTKFASYGNWFSTIFTHFGSFWARSRSGLLNHYTVIGTENGGSNPSASAKFKHTLTRINNFCCVVGQGFESLRAHQILTWGLRGHQNLRY